MIVDTLVFDKAQITSKANGNRPTWGCCHTISAGNAGQAVVIIEPICFRPEQTIKIDVGGTSFTLESREYKAPQCVVIWNDITEDNRNT